MQTVAMLNGEFVGLDEPLIHIEDRGHQFGDGVYEFVPIIEGHLVGFEMHMERLDRSLREMQIPAVYTWEELYEMHVHMAQKGSIENGHIYIQITRGTHPRQHFFPERTVPNVSLVGRQQDLAALDKVREKGVRLISTPDIRWQRCDIKSLNLLGNILSRQKAQDQGAFEALLYRDNGDVTECSSANFMAIKDGAIWAHPNNNLVLSGVTKRIIFEHICPKLDIPIIEKAFNLDFAKGAAEALCSASGFSVIPVVKIDRQELGDGKPGELGQKICAEFKKYALTQRKIL